MSIRVITDVLDARLGKPTWKLVAIKLADHANDEGGSIYPSKEKIAHDTEVSLSTVHRTIRIFCEKGLIREVRRGGSRPGHTTEYAFDVPLLKRLAAGNETLAELPNTTVSKQSKPVDNSVKHGCHSDTHSYDTGVTQTEKGCHGDTQTVKEPSNTTYPGVSAHESDFDDRLIERLLEAGGACVSVTHAQLANLTYPKRWLHDGLGLESDILPAIRAKAASTRKRAVKTWKFFDGPVRDWYAQRANQSGQPVARSRATNSQTVILERYTPSWWRYLFDMLDRGEKVNLLLRQAAAGRSYTVSTRVAPDKDQSAKMVAITIGSKPYHAWRSFLATRGVAPSYQDLTAFYVPTEWPAPQTKSTDKSDGNLASAGPSDTLNHG